MPTDLIAASARIVAAGVERVRRLDTNLSIAAIVLLIIGGLLLTEPRLAPAAWLVLAAAVACTGAACVLDRRRAVTGRGVDGF